LYTKKIGAEMQSDKSIGIIAGSGQLPLEVARAYREHNQGKVYIVALQGSAQISSFSEFNCKEFNIGKVGGIIDYFKSNSVKEIVLAGRIARPDLNSLKVDLQGGILLGKILMQQFKGDDALLRTVADFLEDKGLKVISAQEILSLDPSNNLYTSSTSKVARKTSGELAQRILIREHKRIPKFDVANLEVQEVYTQITPSKQDLIDIELGKKVLKSLGSLDVGQAAVVSEGYVLGIEAAEGTDNLIKRCASLRKENKGGVLIKMLKPNQDSRLDIPTIGPNTIQNLAIYGYSGIAIEQNGVIIVSKKEVAEIANKHKLFIDLFLANN
jgi:hypothetical protein